LILYLAPCAAVDVTICERSGAHTDQEEDDPSVFVVEYDEEKP
jgi:hypothetical protein